MTSCHLLMDDDMAPAGLPELVLRHGVLLLGRVAEPRDWRRRTTHQTVRLPEAQCR